MHFWAAKWYMNNKLDGETTYLLYENWLPKLFRTRRKCREWIKQKYGYIDTRPDLREEPHGWTVPKPIKVSVEVNIKEGK